MRVPDGDVHADATYLPAKSVSQSTSPIHILTYLAMVVVFPEALPNPADTAIIAVVDALFRIVIPQLAYITVIPRRAYFAVDTLSRGRLWRPTLHTEHMLRLFAI